MIVPNDDLPWGAPLLEAIQAPAMVCHCPSFLPKRAAALRGPLFPEPARSSRRALSALPLPMASVPRRQIACFLEVAERRSFVRAAEALLSTQPAVSKMIAELEDALGVVLFERSRRGVQLTSYGEAFLRYAGASVIALRQGVESLVNAQTGGGPRIAIGVLPTVAASVIPRAVKRAKDEGLAATIYLATGTNEALLKLLKEKQLDLVVGRFAEMGLMRDLAFEHLYSEEIVLVGRAGHPLGPSGAFR